MAISPKKVFNTITHQGIKNQCHNEIHLYNHWDDLKKKTVVIVDEYVKILEPSHVASAVENSAPVKFDSSSKTST